MKEFNPERHRIETASALEVVTSAGHQERHAAYVELLSNLVYSSQAASLSG